VYNFTPQLFVHDEALGWIGELLRHLCCIIYNYTTNNIPKPLWPS